jgi:uncharacterized protein YdhG (YjbR/CyaY superfamily)
MRILRAMQRDPRVDAYLAALPSDQRDLLQALRDRVKRLAPHAAETITYAMPGFKLRDRFLLSYAGWKGHCSIYSIHDELLAKYAEALRDNKRTKGGLHFTAEHPLPHALVEEFVRARVETIEAGGR